MWRVYKEDSCGQDTPPGPADPGRPTSKSPHRWSEGKQFIAWVREVLFDDGVYFSQTSLPPEVHDDRK